MRTPATARLCRTLAGTERPLTASLVWRLKRRVECVVTSHCRGQADTQSDLRRPWRQPSEHSFKISGLSDNMLLLQPELDKNIEVQHYIVIKVTFRLFSSF